VERNKDKQQKEAEHLFLLLAHTPCRAHPEDLLYPMEKKLLKGLIGIAFRNSLKRRGSLLESPGSKRSGKSKEMAAHLLYGLL
jgi:hypothetical protein